MQEDLVIPKPYEVLLSKHSRYESIRSFFNIAKLTGYPYFEWNNKIFKIVKNKSGFLDFIETELRWE